MTTPLPPLMTTLVKVLPTEPATKAIVDVPLEPLMPVPAPMILPGWLPLPLIVIELLLM